MRSPFTRRIIEFSAPKHLMPTNLRIYDGSTDLDDHVSHFVGAENQGEWHMPILFRMFQQTIANLLEDKRIPSVGVFDEKNILDNYMDLELLDLHDRCYARQAFVDNVLNKRSREFLRVIEKLKGECDMIKERERAREEESEGIRAKCEVAMFDFEKNLTVVALREKISTLSFEVMSLVAEKPRLETVKVSIRKEVDDVRRDRMEVVLNIVPYAAMELIYSDDLGSLVGKLVTSAIIYKRCKAFDQVAAMKEPFNLTKVKGYRSSYKKYHNQAGNDLAIATFRWLSEFVADPSAPAEVLLTKKPPSIQKPTPLKTQALVVSSQKATPSSVPASNTMSSPADTSVVKPSSF
ncbi:hypothetical protein Tco_1091919 [Tanacetum coccineum]|uniref:Uncharacterized protein n=1 Tax=Tanacetum coccineum TaxID=301880 RepID=A0ABQ5I9K6_9ASTR